MVETELYLQTLLREVNVGPGKVKATDIRLLAWDHINLKCRQYRAVNRDSSVLDLSRVVWYFHRNVEFDSQQA
jgi:hypothetical protein